MTVWLAQCLCPQRHCILATAGEGKNATEKILAQLRRTIRTLFEPILVVEDRASVVSMWRSEGLICLQCAPGEF